MGAISQVRPAFLVGGLFVMFLAFNAAWYFTDPVTTLLIALGLALVAPGLTVLAQESADFAFRKDRT